MRAHLNRAAEKKLSTLFVGRDAGVKKTIEEKI
jgi:hypothetical protein